MQAIIIALIAAAVIAMSTYVAKIKKGEEFQPRKLIRTLGIGLALGIIAHVKGFELTAENWEAYMTANAGIIAIADQVIKGGYRLVGGLISKKSDG